MLNVIVPIVDNSKRYQKILQSLVNAQDVNVFVGVISSQKSNIEMISGDNIDYIEYKDGSHREEIINSLQKYIISGSLLIMRKPIQISELNSFITSHKDICTCSRKLSPIKSFFFNIWQKILKIFLGVKLYDGDTSVIYFSDEISSVILNSSSLSYNSRVDRWKGVDQGTVDVVGEFVKADKDKKSNLNNFLIGLASLIVASVVTTVVCIFATVNITVGLLLFCLDVICLSIIVIISIVTMFNNVVGKKEYEYAVEIDNEMDEIKNIKVENVNNG